MSPVLTNTSLMVLRLCGKYLHLMRALRPIATDVFASMAQLVDYYALVVHAFFTQSLVSSGRKLVFTLSHLSFVSSQFRIQIT